jgi:hypothetical protein
MVLGCFTSSAFRSGRYDVVLDFDGTLVKGVKNKADVPDVVATGNGLVLANGAAHFLTWLSAKPDVRLTFFSAGLEARNNDLVKQLGIKVRGLGRRSIKVYHGKDRVNNAKDLTRLSRRFDLARTVLIDDTPSVCADGQERNLLGVSSLEDDHDRASVTTQARARARNNIIRAAGVLQRSWDILETSPDQDWLEVIAELTWEHTDDGEVIRDAAGFRVLKHEQATYQRGSKVLGIETHPVVVDGQRVMPY